MSFPVTKERSNASLNHLQDFEELKSAILTAPSLSNFLNRRVYSFAGASNLQIGAEMTLGQEDVVKPICYASHVLLKAHQNYCTTRKEPAVVKFCRFFCHYLLGRPFLLHTDQNSLVWLCRFRDIQGQLARWMEELSQ